MGFGETRTTWSIDSEVVEETDVDGYGRTTRTLIDEVETYYVYDGGFSDQAEIVRPGYSELREYDDVGNIVKQTFITDTGEEYIEKRTWDGDVQTSYANALGASTALQVDIHGHATERTNGAGETESYVYDKHQRVTQIADNTGEVLARLDYDGSGNVMTRTFATGQVMSYEYDAMQQLTEVRSSAGPKFVYDIDAKGLPQQLSIYAQADDATPEQQHTYAFGDYDRATLVENEATSKTVDYDDFARTKTVRVDFGDFEKTYVYEMDALGQKVGLTVGNGPSTTYDWSASGSLSQVTVDTHGDVTWDRTEPLLPSMTLPSDVTVTSTLDGFGRDHRVRPVHGRVRLSRLVLRPGQRQASSSVSSRTTARTVSAPSRRRAVTRRKPHTTGRARLRPTAARPTRLASEKLGPAFPGECARSHTLGPSEARRDWVRPAGRATTSLAPLRPARPPPRSHAAS